LEDYLRMGWPRGEEQGCRNKRHTSELPTFHD
jgi:hypothetical protein